MNEMNNSPGSKIEVNSKGIQGKNSSNSIFDSMSSSLNKLITITPDIMQRARNNILGFQLAVILFPVVLIWAIMISFTYRSPTIILLNSVNYWVLAIIILSSLTIIGSLFFHASILKKNEQKQIRINRNSGIKDRYAILFTPSRDENDFIEYFAKLRNFNGLSNDIEIAKIMLEQEKLNEIKKKMIKGYGYKKSKFFQEVKTNKSFIESKYPLNAARVYSMQYVRQGNTDFNERNIAKLPVPVPGVTTYWWAYPWSEVLFSVALIANPENVSNIMKGLIQAYKDNKNKNYQAIQLACKIAISVPIIDKDVLKNLLEEISKNYSKV